MDVAKSGRRSFLTSLSAPLAGAVVAACLLPSKPAGGSPVEPRYRVDIVLDSTGRREPSGGAMTFEQATELAEWFGTQGILHAEVVGPLNG